MPVHPSVIHGRLKKQNCEISKMIDDLVSIADRGEAFSAAANDVLSACGLEWEKHKAAVACMQSGKNYDSAWQDRNYSGYCYMEKYMAFSQAYEHLLAKLNGESFDLLNSCLQKVGFFNVAERREALLSVADDTATDEKNWLKAVVFDKDGTLIHYNKAYGPWVEYRVDEIARHLCFEEDQVKKMYTFLGYDFLRHKVCGESSFIAWAPNEHIRDVLASFIKERLDIGKTSETKVDEIVHEVFMDDTKGIGTIELINSDLRSVFTNLREMGIKIVVMTSDGRKSTQEQLKEHNVIDLVDLLVCGDDPNCRKPHPYGLIRACEVSGCLPSNVVMIGDTRADLLTARAAGVRMVIGVLSGCGTADDLLMDYPRELGADLLIKEVGPALLSILKNFI